ncbi:nitroreductase [Dictyobacter vulcani]|uniref:Nitroreductase n=1 Tax=Dictyobacter vulcani TaxID=2607529 RepID=A0A5J4KMW2_9CHLR|nr:nitroreductase family deazaflavin-dependent oxidoreductase [Dictyobacter vulcani]GER89093.1 nitroreductase [Dictyobacter vulcani]
MKLNPFVEAIWKRIVQLHIALYRLTKGRFMGNRTILITTIGRKSGRSRTRSLYAIRDNGNYVVIASYGGAPQHPDWYRNLQSNPRVIVEDRGRTIPTLATTVTDEDEYRRLWSLMTAMYSGYDTYQKHTERKIPVVVLQPEKP